jgi:hypothetical protein
MHAGIFEFESEPATVRVQRRRISAERRITMRAVSTSPPPRPLFDVVVDRTTADRRPRRGTSFSPTRIQHRKTVPDFERAFGGNARQVCIPSLGRLDSSCSPTRAIRSPTPPSPISQGWSGVGQAVSHDYVNTATAPRQTEVDVYAFVKFPREVPGSVANWLVR